MGQYAAREAGDTAVRRRQESFARGLSEAPRLQGGALFAILGEILRIRFGFSSRELARKASKLIANASAGCVGGDDGAQE